MWIEKTKNGLRICERFTGPDGKTHRASVPLVKNTAQARKAASAELMEKINASQTLASCRTLFGLIAEYLDRINVKESTRRSYERTLRRVSEILGDVIADRLTVPYIKRALSASGKSPRTINSDLVPFNTFLKWAAEYGYISEPLHVSRFPDKAPRRDPALEYLERDELADVLSQLQGCKYYYICKFLALTGCRVGELGALLPEDIDGRYIHINKTYNPENGVTSPKTPSSVRDVFITPELAELLRNYKEWRLLYIMAHKIRPQTLFFNSWGSPISAANLFQALSRVECPKHLHPHIFRHTHVSLLAEQGVSLETIARRLGHTTSKTTREIYFHVTEKLKARDEEILARVSIIG